MKKQYASIIAYVCAAFVGVCCFSAMHAHADESGLTSLAALREETQEGWDETYTAHGRTITINPRVLLPEALTLPVLTVRAHPPVNETIMQAYDGEVQENNRGRIVAARGDLYAFLAKVKGKVDVPRNVLDLRHIDMTTAYAKDNSLTLEDAERIAYEQLSYFYPDDSQLELSSPWQIQIVEYRYVDPKTKEFTDELATDMGHYVIDYYYMLRNIPLIIDVRATFRKSIPGEGGNFWPGVSATIKAEDQYFLLSERPQEVEEVYSDIPVCTFETIKKTCEEWILRGQVRSIESCTLGYVIYHDPQNSELYWAVPSWIIECEYYDSAKDTRPTAIGPGEAYSNAKLVINAQTGEAIDIQSKQINRAMRPEIVTYTN